MQILLFYPSRSVAVDRKDSANHLRSRPPLGLLYLAGSLKANGFDARVIDQTFHPFSERDIERYFHGKEVLFAGFYTNSFLIETVCSYVRALRERFDVPILAGGPGAVHHAELSAAGVDGICLGEGERIIVELARDFLHGHRSSCRHVRAPASGGESPLVFQGEPIADLDSLPMPDWEEAELDRYEDLTLITQRRPFATMMASRGCPLRCAFCFNYLGRSYRVRSVENVLGEMDLLVNSHGIRYVAFQDDVFGMQPAWLDDFCREMAGRQYGLRWMCILNPGAFGPEVNRKLEMMKRGGCDALSFGLQSADPEILRNIHRDPDEPKHLREILGAAHRLGMMTSIEFIFGLPGETRSTIQRNIRYARNSRTCFAEFHTLYIMPMTELAERRERGPLSCLEKDALRRAVRGAYLKFYLDPLKLLKIFRSICKNNPSFFFRTWRIFLWLPVLVRSIFSPYSPAERELKVEK